MDPSSISIFGLNLDQGRVERVVGGMPSFHGDRP